MIALDPWLEPYRDAIRHRFSFAERWIKSINEVEGGLDKFSKVCLFRTCCMSIGWCALFLWADNNSIPILGLREIRLQCPEEWRHHLQGMGTQCCPGLSGRRF